MQSAFRMVYKRNCEIPNSIRLIIPDESLVWKRTVSFLFLNILSHVTSINC